MDRDTWYEREENDIMERFSRGDIDRDQMNYELRDLRHDLRSQYEKDLDDARQRVNEDWGH